MNSIRGLLVSFVFSAFIAMAYCQLTFSPYWGKRSGADNGVVFESKGNCKNANEILMEVLRFMQVQAQFYVDCTHKE